jgi:hypothetical protein
MGIREIDTFKSQLRKSNWELGNKELESGIGSRKLGIVNLDSETKNIRFYNRNSGIVIGTLKLFNRKSEIGTWESEILIPKTL